VVSWKRLALIWSVPIALGAWASFANAREAGHPVSVARAIWLGLGNWLVWPVVTPVVVRLGQRWRLDQPPRWRALPAHVVAAAAIGILTAAVTAAAVFDPAAGRPLAAHVSSRVGLRGPMGSTLYFIILGVSYLAINTRRLREEELRATRLSKELNEAQLAALRWQLQPHFLFNSLNAVMALIRDREMDQADRALGLLSDFLRRTLDEARSGPTVPLTRELEFIRTYLELETLRFGDRLQVFYAVPAEVGAVRVPSFLLQPLVENALRHGIMDLPDGGTIWIAAEARGRTLVLSVADDGVGFDESRAKATGSGVGIANVRARLAHLYGPAASLVVTSRPGRSGTRAIVELPCEGGP
jgi:signal transduction histidine kinase